MRKLFICCSIFLGIGLIMWYTGLFTLGYQYCVLTLAFLAHYLTPQQDTTQGIDQAWQQWWQMGEAIRWHIYQHDKHLQTITGDYAVLFGSGLVLALMVLVPWRTMKLKVSTVHGSAHWATLHEARPFFEQFGSRTRRTSRIPLGTYRGRQLCLKEQTVEEHVLIVGPSGKGKTAGVIVPGILSEQGQRSLVIIDPKQELVRLTAGAVSQHMKVLLFAPTQPEKSQRYNPLAHIQSMEDAEDFAACWVSNTGRSNDPFWDRNAELLITATVLHLRASEPHAPFSRLADLLSGSSFEELDDVLSHSPSPEAHETAAAFMKNLKLNEKTAGGVFTDIAGRFFRLRNPKLRAVTAGNEINFTTMIEEPTALYLSIPASATERLQPLMACLLMQMFTAFVNRAEREPAGKLPRGITCYLDEFANAGKIPHMDKRISMLRSTRVGLILAIQNHSQLDALYCREHKDTILSNATTHIVFPGTGQDETEFYSRRIGDTTVIGQSMSKNTAPRQSNWNQGQQETSRRLILPEEIRTMKRGHMLLLSDTIAPITFQNVPYYKHPQIKKLANKHFVFHIPVSDRDDTTKSEDMLIGNEEGKTISLAIHDNKQALNDENEHETAQSLFISPD